MLDSTQAERRALQQRLYELCQQIVIDEDMTQLVVELNKMLNRLDTLDEEVRRAQFEDERPTMTYAATAGGDE